MLSGGVAHVERRERRSARLRSRFLNAEEHHQREKAVEKGFIALRRRLTSADQLVQCLTTISKRLER